MTGGVGTVLFNDDEAFCPRDVVTEDFVVEAVSVAFDTAVFEALEEAVVETFLVLLAAGLIPDELPSVLIFAFETKLLSFAGGDFVTAAIFGAVLRFVTRVESACSRSVVWFRMYT